MDLSRDDRYWHIASFRCVAKFGRYWRHSGHGSVSIRLSSRLDHPLGRHRMPPDMNKHEDIAKALKAHLSELTGALRRSTANCANRCLLIPKTGQLTSKIRTRSK